MLGSMSLAQMVRWYWSGARIMITSLGGSLGHGLDLEALLLGEVDRLGGRTQADDHVDTGIAKVQRVGVAWEP